MGQPPATDSASMSVARPPFVISLLELLRLLVDGRRPSLSRLNALVAANCLCEKGFTYDILEQCSAFEAYREPDG